MTKIKSINYLGKGKVVNLNVKNNKTFITKNGIPTHNCDRLSAAAMDALLDLLERVQKNTRFIFVGNRLSLTDELKSRCQIIQMDDPPAKQIYHFCKKILDSENIKLENKESLITTIKNLYPDIRHIINTLQLNAIDGRIKEIVYSSNEDFYREILDLIKEKKLQEVRKKLKSNIIDYSALYYFIFDNVGEFSSPADMIIELGEALRWDSQVSIKEINFITMLTKSIKNNYI